MMTSFRIAVYCLLLICCLPAAGLLAQQRNPVLRGVVMDPTRQPLVAASIAVFTETDSLFFSTLSDSNGIFLVSLPLSRVFRLSASFTGYELFTKRFSPDQIPPNLQIILVQKTDSLAGVVVEQKKNLVELNGNNLVYNLSRTMDAQGTNALEALRKAPGVFIDNNNNISVNGKAGPLVLIDGRQTYLSASELADLLKSMPSSGIQSFEITTAPGARYDAAGTAGIINIKTIKTQVRGFSGSGTTGFSYGIKARQNQDLNVNYRNNDFNIYGGYNHSLGNYKYEYGSDRIQQQKRYQSFTDDVDKRQRIGGRLGIDYTIDKENTIGVLATGNFVVGGGLTETKTAIGPPVGNLVDQTLDAVNDYYYQQTNRYNFNLNYKYENAVGTILNFDADYGIFKKGNGNLQTNRYTDNIGNILTDNLYRSMTGIDINLTAFRLDYTRKLWKGLLETGGKFSSVNTSNNALFYHVKQSGDSLDERRTNTFSFNEQISAGYISYKRSGEKWSVQGGLRLENAQSKGLLNFKNNGIDSVQQIRRNYTNLFPSVSLSWRPGAGHAWSVAYSRRIDRPVYQDLNPFIYLLDELSFWQGNPFLLPQLSHRVSLQYAWKSSTIIGLSYTHTDRYSTGITDTLDQNKIVMTPRNLGLQQHLALTLTQNFTIRKWWDLSFNGNLYGIRNKISFDEYRDFDLKQLAARLNLQQRFRLPYKMMAEIIAVFNSGRLTGANQKTRYNSQVDLGLQRVLWKDKATIRIVLNDIYKGAKFYAVQQYGDFYMNDYGYYESRQIRVNFTYKFANSSMKAPRTRNSALENENSRIK